MTTENASSLEKCEKIGGSVVRVPLQASLLISPLLLLHNTFLTSGTYNRNHMIEYSLALGSDKPELILDVEKKIWQALFKLSEANSFPFDVIWGLRDSLPWEKINAARNTPSAAWFNLSNPVIYSTKLRLITPV